MEREGGRKNFSRSGADFDLLFLKGGRGALGAREAAERFRSMSTRRSRSPQRRTPTVSTTEQVANDCEVAALASALPGCQPQPTLRLLNGVRLALKALFWVGNVPSCILLLLLLGGGTLDSSTMSHALWSLLSIQLFLYAIVGLLASSTTAQGWITFGHPARVIGAANSGGPFDRGARFLGVRDYSQPCDCGLAHARSVRIQVADGNKGSLGAWHALPGGMARDVLEAVARGQSVDLAYDGALRASRTRASEDSAPLAAIYLHGNFESRSKWVSVEHVRMLSTLLGLHVLVFDYRGFADSTGGPPSPDTLGEDAHAVVDWLEARGIPPSRVLLYGHSLGSGAAAQLSLRLEAAGTPPFAAILEAPFYSLRAAALTFPAALPLLALPGAHSLVLRSFMNGCRTGDAVAQLPTLPLLLLHGDDDTTVPIQHSVMLSRRVEATRGRRTGVPFRFEALHGCDHLQVLLHPRTLPTVSAFLRDVSKKAT